MKLKAKESVPAGNYSAEFIGVEETDHPDYGAGLRWDWEITSGRWRGQVVSRTTKCEATRKNGAGKFLMTFSGKPWDEAKKCDTDDFIGTKCQVIVAETESGSSRVESFVPVTPQADDVEDAAGGKESPF